MILGIDASQANKQIRSGTEWYAFYLIREFKKLLNGRDDITVRLYLRDRLRPDLAENLPANFETKILRWPPRRFWTQIRLSWEMLMRPPDVLFVPAHTIPLIHPPLNFPPLKKGGVRGGGKTFTTLHDVGFKDYPELYDKFSLWYHRFSAKLAAKEAYHIFTISEFSKNRIVENYDCDPNKITVIYLGIDPNLSVAKNTAILGQYGLTDQNYILYIGRLEPKKNILGMIKGYEIADIKHDLVFAGKKVNIKDVEDYLKEKPELAKKIRFLGYISEEDKPALYSGAAIFLFSTLYEGFGLPIVEAQSRGVPVITSNTASNPEIAGDGALIVDPESPYEIAEAIKDVLNDKNLRQKIIALGLENVKQFSWKETAKKTLEMMGILD